MLTNENDVKKKKKISKRIFRNVYRKLFEYCTCTIQQHRNWTYSLIRVRVYLRTVHA